jgi:ribosomal protein S18 acetylase RimI-like enzyme
MSPAYAIAPVITPAEFGHLRALLREYQTELDVDLCFQDFEGELAHIERIYNAPQGAAFLAWDLAAGERSLAGCIALRPLAPGVCEMKRLYVRPAHRRAGVARALAVACMRRGRELGYARMRLDTLASMTAARALYESLGFIPIAAYYHNPHPGTCFMECKLSDTG